MPCGGKRRGSGRKPLPRLTKDEFGAKVREQRGLCALCSDPGSVGGLVIDADAIRRKVRGLIHPKCKRVLALVCDDPIRLKKAIDYLELHGVKLFQNPL